MFETASWRSWAERLVRTARAGGALPLVGLSAAVGVAAAAALLWSQHRLTAGPADPVAALPRAVRITTTLPPPAPLVVHVAGAVLEPGLVTLADGARVADAIVAAGGLRPDADLGRVNLAEKLGDGGRLYVPAVGEMAPPLVGHSAGSSVGPSGGAGVGPSGGAGGGVPLDVNRATEAQLDELPGVGPATAAAIVAHRDRNGPFASVEELGEVRGIGPAKLEALRPLVTV